MGLTFVIFSSLDVDMASKLRLGNDSINEFVQSFLCPLKLVLKPGECSERGGGV